MRRSSAFLIIAAALAAPAMGTAQVADHVSLYRGGGLGLRSYSSFGAGFGFHVGGFGASLGFSVGFGTGFYDNYHGLYRPFNTPFVHCWDDYWYDPYDACHGFGPFWGPGYGYWSAYNPWRFGFLGWPSPRHVRSHWYGFSPFWSDYWGPSWGGYDYWYGPRYRRYYDYPGTRVVRRTPLYGPRFKEYPAPPVYVTDNGPERPVSRLGGNRGAGGFGTGINRPDDRGSYAIGTRTARPRDGSDARPTPPRVRARPRADGGATTTPRARPRSSAGGSDQARPRDTRTIRPGVVQRPPIATSRPDTRRPSTRSAPTRVRQPNPIRSAPPRVRSRPMPRERIEPPRREAPGVRSTPSRRPSPTVRSFPSRTPTPRARPAPSRMPTPKARSAPSRGSAPKARAAPSRAPRPSARPAPSRAPKPKARSAPARGSGSRKSPPRRPARRPGS